MNVSIALEKGGQKIHETSTVSQILKYTRPINGVIKLYCYSDAIANSDTTMDKITLKPSRHEINNPEVQAKKGANEKKGEVKK